MAATQALRVVVGEDQPLIQAGVVRALEQDGFDVVAVAGDAPDLLRKTRAHKPDVVVTDIQMPPESTDDGLRAAIEIRATQPEIGVVVLSQFL
jgi:DNA-binding NarL/FixJ family response regulator